MHDNVIGIASFQNGLYNLFSSTGLYFKSKVVEGSNKGKYDFFCLIPGHFFLKCTIFVTFFSRLVII